MADAARDRGNAAYKAGRFAEAIEAYSSGLPVSGSEGGGGDAGTTQLLLLNRAAAYMAVRAYGAAVDDLAALLATDGGNVKALLRLALSLLALGHIDGASATLTALTSAVVVADGAWPAVKDAQAAVDAVTSQVAALSAPLSELGGLTIVAALGGGALTADGVAAGERDVAALAGTLAAVPASPLVVRALVAALVRARRCDTAAAVLATLVSSTSGGGGRHALEGVPPTVTAIPLPDESVLSLPGGSSASGGEGESAVMAAATLALALGDFAGGEGALRAELRGDPDGSTPAGAAALALSRTARRLAHLKDAANDKYKAGDHAGAEAGYGELAAAAAAALGGYTPALVYANLAAVHLAQGRVEEATADARLGLAAHPFNSRLWQRLGGCYEAAKPSDHEAAARAFAAAQYLAGSDDATLAAKTFAAVSKADTASDDLAGLLSLVHPRDDAAAGATLAQPPGLRPRSLPSLFAADPAVVPHRLLLVDAFATWCGPCKAIAPYFERLAASHAVPAFIKVDGDACRGTAAKLGVRAFPTFVMYLDGKEVDRLEGADPRSLDDMLARGLNAWRKAPHGSSDPAAPPALRAMALAPECSPEVVAVVAPAWRALHGFVATAPRGTAAAAAAAAGGSSGSSRRR